MKTHKDMDNLEKILTTLPKHKLSCIADFRMTFKLRRLMFVASLKQSVASELNFGYHPMAKAFTAVLVIVVIFGATSIYAYANGDILPGDRIYPLKRAVEKIEQKIAPASAKIKVVEKHSTRRLEEAVNLSEQNSSVEQKKPKQKEAASESIKKNIEKNIEAVVSNQQEIADSINDMDDYEKAVETMTGVKKVDKAKAQYLDKIIENAEITNDEETVKKAKQAQEAIDKQKYKFKNKEINKREEIEEREETQETQETSAEETDFNTDRTDIERDDGDDSERGNNKKNDR